MADFNNLALTASGVKALLAAQAGTTLTLSKIGMGSGSTEGNVTSLTNLVTPKLMLPISEKKIDSSNNLMTITAIMTNEDMTEGFYWRETGLFFQDSDGNDVLFAYACISDDQYDYVPAYSDQRYAKHIRIADIVTDSADIEVLESEGLLYVDTLTFEEYKAEVKDSILDSMDEIKENTEEKKIAGAIALKELYEVLANSFNIKTYSTLAQFGLSDNDMGATADDFVTNMSKINEAIGSNAFIFHYYSTSTSHNLRSSILNKLGEDGFGFSSSSAASISVYMKRDANMYDSIEVDVVYGSESYDNTVFSCIYNKDTAGERVSTFVHSKHKAGFLPLTGGTLTGDLHVINILPVSSDNYIGLGSDGKAFACMDANKFRLYKNSILYAGTSIGSSGNKGIVFLDLGNANTEDVAENAAGRIRIYGTGSGYTMMVPGNNGDTNATITLPSASGTLATTHSSNVYNFTQKGLNSVNIDDVYNYGYMVTISDTNHGTVPSSGYLNIVNFYTGSYVTQLAFTCKGTSTADREVKAWMRERIDSTGTSPVWSTWRVIHSESTITAGTTDLTAGSSSLDTGCIYQVYE